jgi:O-antigen/teichoic acid export membrane protein
LKEKDIQANRLRSQRLIVRLVILFVALSFATWIILEIALLTGIVDGKYQTVLPLLPIVLLSSIITSLTPMYSNHLIYLEKLYLVVAVGIPIALLSILLNWSLVPSYGIYGAAASSLVTGLCYLASYAVLSNMYYKRKLADSSDRGDLQ